MKVSVPASAPGTPPETGASSMLGLYTLPELADHSNGLYG